MLSSKHFELSTSTSFANMASCNPTINYVNYSKLGLTFFNLDVTAATLSMFALTTVALIILSDEKIKAHPNKMIAYVFLCDAYLFC